MRIRDYRDDDTPEINLVPLIDVLLCLLIFFVVTTTFDATPWQAVVTTYEALGQLGFHKIANATAPAPMTQGAAP